MLTLDQARELLLAWDRTGGHPYRDAAVVIAAPDGAKLTIEEYIFSLNPREFEAAEISPDGRSRRFLPGLPKKDLDGLDADEDSIKKPSLGRGSNSSSKKALGSRL